MRRITRRRFLLLLLGAAVVAFYTKRRRKFRLILGGNETWGDESFDTAEQAYHQAFMVFATIVDIPLGVDAERVLRKHGEFKCDGFWARVEDGRAA
jgi:hypothetical protein